MERKERRTGQQGDSVGKERTCQVFLFLQSMFMIIFSKSNCSGI